MFTIQERFSFATSTFFSVLLAILLCELWVQLLHAKQQPGVLRGFATLVAIIGHDVTMNRTLRNVRTMVEDLFFTSLALQLTVYASSVIVSLVWSFFVIAMLSFLQHSVGLKLSMSIVPMVLQTRMFDSISAAETMLRTLLVSCVCGMVAAVVTSVISTPHVWLHKALKSLSGVSSCIASQVQTLIKVFATYPRHGVLQLRLLEARCKFWMSRLEFLQPHFANTPFNRMALDTSDKVQVCGRTCALLACSEAGMQQVLAEDVILMQAEIRHLFAAKIGPQLRQLGDNVSSKLSAVMAEVTSKETPRLTGTRSRSSRFEHLAASRAVIQSMTDLATEYKHATEQIYFNRSVSIQLKWQELLSLNTFLFFLNYISALVLSLDTVVEKHTDDPILPPIGRFVNVIRQYATYKFRKFRRQVHYLARPWQWKWVDVKPKLVTSVKISVVWAIAYLCDWLLLAKGGVPQPSLVAFTTAYLIGSPHRSGTIDTGIQRFIGTVISMTAVAILMNFAFLRNEELARVAMVLILIFFSSWLRSHPKLSHAGTVSAFTIGVVVLDGQHPLRRIEQTVVGILIMTAIELLISPSVSKQLCINQYRYTLEFIKESQAKLLRTLDNIEHDCAQSEELVAVVPGETVIPVQSVLEADPADDMTFELKPFMFSADILVEDGKSSRVYEQVAASCAKLDRLLDQAESDLFWEGIFGSPKVPGEFERLAENRGSKKKPRKPGTPFDGDVYRKIHAALRLCGVFSQSLESALLCLTQAHHRDPSHSAMKHLFYALKGPFKESVQETTVALDKLCKLVEWLNDRPVQPDGSMVLPKELKIFVGAPIRLESTVLTAELLMRQAQTSTPFGASKEAFDDNDLKAWVGEATRSFFFKFDDVCKQLQPKFFKSQERAHGAPMPSNLELQAFNALVFCQFKLLSVIASLISHTQELLIHAYSAEGN